MPNPLSRVRRDAKPHYGPDMLATRPELAIMAMECIALWSHVEGAMGRLIAHMLKASVAAPAVAMFQSLTSGSARLDALWAAAEATLDKTNLEYLDAGIRYVRRIANQRHSFAHHIWGACDELPDALLLIDPKELAAMTIRERQHLEKLKALSIPAMFAVQFEGAIGIDHDKVWVYIKKDFEAFARTAHNANVFFVSLMVMLDEQQSLGPEGIRVLIASPEFQTVLSG